MSRLTVGNIAVEAQRAVRLNSQAYGDRVINLIDELVASKKLSPGGLKEMLRAREIFCGYFYENNSDYVEAAIEQLMRIAYMERSTCV